jgi:Uma2 family endonuclease
LKLFAAQSGVRTTYDRGEFEIMYPSFEHDNAADILGRFVVTLTEEFQLPIQHGGSVTLRLRRFRRGLEPDRCYWIAHEPQVRGLRQLDLRIHPPPDLAIEVDVSRRSLNRMRVYARLGVPEVWRFDDPALEFLVLQPNGKYAQAAHSLSFPQVSPTDLLRFVALCRTTEKNALVAQFRQWVRTLVGTAGAAGS